MTEDWREKHANDAGEALKHPLVLDVMREYADNMGFDPDHGLPYYGLHKVALYAAQVARAQALGFDPELLRMSDEEARSEQLRLAAQAVFDGVPTFVIEGEDPNDHDG